MGTATFSRQNKPHKASVQEMITDRIYYQLSPEERAYGIHVYTLAGDDVRKCFGINKKLLSRNGKMYSAENDSEKDGIYTSQLVQHRDMGRPEQLKLKPGEFLSIVYKNLQRTRTPTLFIDYDACCQLQTLVEKDLDEIFDVADKCKAHQHTVWFSVTYCRAYNDNRNERIWLQHLEDAWTYSLWNVKSKETYRYKDGMPMSVTIWRFER